MPSPLRRRLAPAVVATQRPAPAPSTCCGPLAPNTGSLPPAAAALVATPAPAPAAAPDAAKQEAAKDAKEVTAAVQAWAAAWAAKDMKAYLAAYGKDFDPPGRMTRAAWEKNVRPGLWANPRSPCRCLT